MFDFRYHALSLTAVLIALAVGLLLGVAIGDSGLVSSAERNIRQSLKKDVADANRRVKATRADLARADRFQREVYPLLVGGQLSGRSVGLLALGQTPKGITGDVRDALRDTDATLKSYATVAGPPDLQALGQAATGSRYAALADTKQPDLDLVEALGFRLGAQYARGGKLLAREKQTVFDTFNGKLGPVDAVVVAYDPKTAGGYTGNARDRFDQGLVKGLRASGIPVVGVQRTDTDPSRIGWYKDRDISSVDDVDEVSGRAALVFALQGSQGAFGRNEDSLLPDVKAP